MSEPLGTVGQIAISVTDMESSIAFYRDRVGLKFLFSAPNVAFFDCDGIRLMLGHHPEPQTPFHGTAIYFRVADIQQEHRALLERGVDSEREPMMIAKMPDHDLWMSFYRDPDRNLFALMSEVRA